MNYFSKIDYLALAAVAIALTLFVVDALPLLSTYILSMVV